MRYVMRIFDTPLLEFEASYGEGLQAGEKERTTSPCRRFPQDNTPMRNFETDTPKYVKTKHPYIWTYQ